MGEKEKKRSDANIGMRRKRVQVKEDSEDRKQRGKLTKDGRDVA